ncbi:MAG: amidohydrolase family protein, partial [Myxococcota bacterium]
MRDRRVIGASLLVLGFALAWALRPHLAPESNGDVAARRESTAIDLLIERAQLPGGTVVSVAIRDGRVVALGNDVQFSRRFVPNETVDAAGGMILGGVHDHHAHVLLGGLGLDALQLSELETLNDVEAELRRYAALHPEADWIVGRGWKYSMFPGGQPTRALLDAWVPSTPVLLKSYDGHAQWTNTAGLERAGITRETKDPNDGTIVRASNGEPTGLFLEGARAMIEDAAPPLTDRVQMVALEKATAHLLSRGITTVDDMVYRDGEERARLYRALRSEGRLPIAVRIFPVLEASADEDTLTDLAGLAGELESESLLSLPAVKI